jgi:hypothetical protein
VAASYVPALVLERGLYVRERSDGGFPGPCIVSYRHPYRWVPLKASRA